MDVKKFIDLTVKSVIRENNWFDYDEPSIADKYFANKTNAIDKNNEGEISAQLIGTIYKSVTGKTFSKPIKIYKNPKNLNGFLSGVRGVLTEKLDFYVASDYDAFHDDILKLLSDENILPFSSIINYEEKYPDEFVAVQRNGEKNSFSQSTLYEGFPNNYLAIFDEANSIFNYDFISDF